MQIYLSKVESLGCDALATLGRPEAADPRTGIFSETGTFIQPARDCGRRYPSARSRMELVSFAWYDYSCHLRPVEPSRVDEVSSGSDFLSIAGLHGYATADDPTSSAVICWSTAGDSCLRAYLCLWLLLHTKSSPREGNTWYSYKVHQRPPCTLRQKIQSLILRSVGGKRLGFFIRFGIAQTSY